MTDYITIQEACDILKIAYPSIRYNIDKGGLDYIIGRNRQNRKTIMVSLDSVKTFFDKRIAYGKVDKGFITVFSAANKFGCSDDTIRTLVDRGNIRNIFRHNKRGVVTMYVFSDDISKVIHEVSKNGEYMDRFQVAELFGYDARVVQKWASKNRIPSIARPRIGRGRDTVKLYPRADIEEIHKTINKEPNISDDFGNYLSGITDGEGSFMISVRQGKRSISNDASFKLSLREDDFRIIIAIRKNLGFGSIYRKSGDDTRNAKPQVGFETTRHIDALRLIKIFDKYPLRAKKARDYAIWREFVLERSKPNVDQNILDRLCQEIVEIRKHASPPKEAFDEIRELNKEVKFRFKSYGLGKHK